MNKKLRKIKAVIKRINQRRNIKERDLHLIHHLLIVHLLKKKLKIHRLKETILKARKLIF
jgi:hypothetical protein